MQERSKRALESHYRILVLQVVAVVAVLLSAVTIRIFGGDTYRKLSIMYHDRFDDITLSSEVLGESEPEATESQNSEVIETESSKIIADLYDEILDRELNETITEEEDMKTLSVSASAQSFLIPVTGTVVSEYGMRTNPVTGIYCLHGGIDIAARSGTDIYAAYDGVVTAAGYSSSYGNYIIIEHNSNIKTLYAHCSKLIAKEGQSIAKGDLIALVGSTGRSTGPHLHFEVRIGGNRIDPRWILGESTLV
ncbi:MAG: M23 family metallopeptidase [Ruminococcaceae bacterium]|nr:M23 family metallopeptidase [Oscillospiraceae bacterium]